MAKFVLKITKTHTQFITIATQFVNFGTVDVKLHSFINILLNVIEVPFKFRFITNFQT